MKACLNDFRLTLCKLKWLCHENVLAFITKIIEGKKMAPAVKESSSQIYETWHFEGIGPHTLRESIRQKEWSSALILVWICEDYNLCDFILQAHSRALTSGEKRKQNCLYHLVDYSQHKMPTHFNKMINVEH